MSERELLTEEQIKEAIKQIEYARRSIRAENMPARHLEEKYINKLHLVEVGLKIALGACSVIELSPNRRIELRLDDSKEMSGGAVAPVRSDHDSAHPNY
ncbi:hypothetical protein A3A14_01345 [Candidatus Daviesbacteria bacterium RIFCSPLOWO2_01_FULL_43_38]|uniref:Uncharacterized protein n=3 Tax=Candidatus Daviesiibacteriota TaxID=1752718 RepID=A0A1F5K7E8_9BACT|nr:MAG: hypothetical protein UV33_C0003G0010 [Candidatus Daviesbacteria bacterium GW2011_GWA1_42_6]KKS70273.1 MAG: hypothetical protein UV41_C0030G0005 [Candidatus Daviesbacteria bacterium GW2011_GWA2_42_7]OGE18979.1 MAG: hypothetical protein A2874_02370 [Candidatus Daviesbacteria bacterium RIFCSPHIGHO2_01_FULL_43_17]OGE36876.1 MAG: hypothetical protein A3E45_03470 [Candidatus Daviesbacteria bacterium RIFCSPHIGHO2_12_FULL_43_11]OGE63302.1 MAG: hypothetical protein A3A14_01345 [Candidatus Davies